MDSPTAKLFAADATLGKLAKWLRILGFDTIFDPKVSPDRFIEYGIERTLLTRTERVRDENRSYKLIFITSDDPFEQIGEVIQSLGLEPRDTRLFSRCTECNVSVRPVDKILIRHRVPDYVWETHDTFKTCDGCGRIYWSGSHTQKSREIIDRLFASLET